MGNPMNAASNNQVAPPSLLLAFFGFAASTATMTGAMTALSFLS
ncbi:hypothetical protein [Methylobacterium soli]|nr:hypothetical protein [Methylobacterium soli]GJE42792.1 hypothetical protein AEGHOMDF_1965 [Methylobacterium soli]